MSEQTGIDQPLADAPSQLEGVRDAFSGAPLQFLQISEINKELAFTRLCKANVMVTIYDLQRSVDIQLCDEDLLDPELIYGSWSWLRATMPDVNFQLRRASKVLGSDEPSFFFKDQDHFANYLRFALMALAEQDHMLIGLISHARFSLDGHACTVRLPADSELVRVRRWEVRLSDLLFLWTGVKVSIFITEHHEQREIMTEFRRTVEQEVHIAVQNQTVQAPSEGNNVKADTPPQQQSILFGTSIEEDAQPISQVQDEMRRVTLCGRVFGLETRDLASGRQLVQFHLTDDTDSLTCKIFSKGTKKESGLSDLADGQYLRVRGSVQYDQYMKELALSITDMQTFVPQVIADDAPEKRIELHAHTQMSSLDGVVSATDLVKWAKNLGHEAVAVTDHGVVQAYPEAFSAGKKYGLKVLYGVEAYLIDTGQTVVYRPTGDLLTDDTTYVIFDTETTGLSASENELIEIAGVKMQGDRIVDTFASLIEPKAQISAKITEITNITNEMVAGQPPVEHVLPQFRAFCEGCVLVAHNAEFDMAFLSTHAKRIGMQGFEQPVIDTLALARIIFPNDRNHRLKSLTQKFDVKLINHHRALADSEATGHVFFKLLQVAKERAAIQTLRDLAQMGESSSDFSRSRSYHASILVRSMTGLRNMYKLVSRAHIDYFYREPRTPRKLLQEMREGLLIGSGCKFGELFQAILRGKSRDELLEMMRFYDYIEIQPPDHYAPLIESEEVGSLEVIKEYQLLLLDLADELEKPIVATGDVHFLRKEDGIYREIIQSGTVGGRDRPKGKQPQLSFRTTQDMLTAFAHLGERAREVVIDNPKRISDMIESISPVPDRVYPPIMEGADDEVRRVSYEKVHQVYGETLPQVVSERLEKELHSIVTNGFSVNYLIAHKLVTKSLSDGYIVGSRGSVGSSFVATMMDITEVNPLAPHYICKTCRYTEFILDGSIGSGFDLVDKDCPQCGHSLAKDGQDIPFETFLGFKGDKVPDIDLNFSGEYQSRAHKYTEELFGSDFVYRAGTISTIAEKTAFGYVRKWAEDSGRQLRNAEIARLVAGCTGIKRTTGQHPGGLIIVPSDHEIFDFCPIQFPADDRTSGTRTTHFDFHSIHDNLLKLDILGHDDPTVLRMLQDITGMDTRSVPVDDPLVYGLFCGTESLGVKPQQIRSNTGTFGIPEFGTKFVRQMLEDTKPSTFADLVRISGLSHGTDVWLTNAQELIRRGVAPLQEVICCRDDIMVYLIYRGLDPSRAFKIMESVRKGKGVSEEDAKYMQSFDVPQWYLDSCQKIKYMFPKAHAAAYVLNAVRIAYFKVHHPLAFYAAYFTVRAEDFDLMLMERGADAIDARIAEIESKGNTAMPKEKALQTVLEVALEMTRRGFRFYPLDLYQSDATRFLLKDDGLLPPFAAAPGIGETAARNIMSARQQAEFVSIEDIGDRAHVSKTVLELLEGYGCLQDLPASNQLSLF